MVTVEEKYPLPPVVKEPDKATPADHIQISERLWEDHLPMELEKDNRLQASEKIWGSVAHLAIGAGKQRNWDVGRQHDKMRNAVVQLGAELDQEAGSEPGVIGGEEDSFTGRFDGANLMHQNFYRNNKDEDRIEEQTERVGVLISELKPLVEADPLPYAPDDIRDQRRLARLWGKEVPPNREAEAQKAALDKLFPLDGVRRIGPLPDDSGDSNGSGGGVPADGSPPNKPSPLTLHRREQRTTTPVEPGTGERPRRQRRQAPKAPALGKASVGRGKERRRVIKPRLAAQRQSARR